MSAIQQRQLKSLCSSADTLERAQSILRLVLAKTRPGSGFVVKTTAAIPPICAYLASEALNMGEVSLQSAKCAACVTQTEFNDTLKTLRVVLCTDQEKSSVDVTYGTLVDAYGVLPRDDAIACMEDTEAALLHVHMLKERHGATTLTCAVFYWVYQLLEESTVQERALCQTYSIKQAALKAIVKSLDKQCDAIAEQIKSVLSQKRKCAPTLRSTTGKTTTPARTPSKKRTVAFDRLPPDGDVAHDDGASFPGTPTKKRRVDASPRKSRSPVKRSSAASTAAFYAAVQGSPSKPSTSQASASPAAGPSTPRRPRHTKVTDMTTTSVQATPTPSPSRSQALASPTRLPVRRRFRAVFLEQQQWCARDPKVDRMWAAADKLLGEMVEAHGHPFQRHWTRPGAVIGAA